MQVRTDLAMERASDCGSCEGVRVSSLDLAGFSRNEVDVDTEDAARRLQKPRGRYVTFTTEPIHTLSQKMRLQLAQTLADTLKTFLPPFGDVLIIGLGNRHITSDALGSRVVEGVLVTRHLRDSLPEDLRGRLRGVCTLAPGVLGITGMETADMVRGVVEQIRPAAVIAVDALAARECARIGTAIQVTDTGILPGSGVGNHRMGLTRETLGVPVVAIGVPMVVYSSVIIRDALTLLLHSMPEDENGHEAAVEALTQRVVKQKFGDLVVTPREIDQMVSELAQVLGMALNIALQPRLSREELLLLTNEAL